jgi:hypothetical protein
MDLTKLRWLGYKSTQVAAVAAAVVAAVGAAGAAAVV